MRAASLMGAIAVLVCTSALAAPPRTPAHLDVVPSEVLVASDGDSPLALAPGGRPLAGGVYFARLESAGESAVRKRVRLGP